MAIDKKLIEVLCCPVTKVPVVLLEGEKLAKLNALIQEGRVKDKGGEAVKEPLEEALTTEDGKTIYPVRTGIPVMLEERGIPTEGLEGWS